MKRPVITVENCLIAALDAPRCSYRYQSESINLVLKLWETKDKLLEGKLYTQPNCICTNYSMYTFAMHVCLAKWRD